MRKSFTKIFNVLLCMVFCVSLIQIPAAVNAADEIAKPVASQPKGLYREAISVELSCETDGATIYYTTDNLMPDETSAVYTTPIAVTESTNISAIAVKDGKQSAPVSFSYIIKDQEEPLLQFVMMSDFHVDAYTGTEDTAKVEKMEAEKKRVASEFDVIHAYFPKADAIIFAGDLINDNSYNGQPSRAADHGVVKQLIEENLERLGMNETQVKLAVGNHDDEWEAMIQYYPEEWLSHTGNGDYTANIKGYPFIFVNSQYGINSHKAFLEKELAAAAETGKPIFFTMHKPIANTVWTDGQGTMTGFNDYLKQYPQVFTFAGHTHSNMNDERAIHQKDFTSLNTASSSYIEIDGSDMLVHTPKKGVQTRFELPVTQAYFVEVFADRVEFDRVALNADFGDVKDNGYIPREPYNNTGVIIGERWIVETGENMKDKFRYTEPRQSADLQFAEDAEAVLNTSGEELEVTFPQAQDVQRVHHYNIQAVNEKGEVVGTTKVYPDNAFAPIPKTLTYPVRASLPEGETIRVQIVAADSFGNTSEPLQAEGSYDVPVQPASFKYFNESFDKALTDPSTQPVPNKDNDEIQVITGDGKLDIQYISKDSGVVFLPFGNGYAPKADKKPVVSPVAGNNVYVDVNFVIPTKMNRSSIFICNSMTANNRVFGFDLYKDKIILRSDGNKTELDQKKQIDPTEFGVEFGKENHLRVHLDMTDKNNVKLKGWWLNDKKVTTVASVNAPNVTEPLGEVNLGTAQQGLSALQIMPFNFESGSVGIKGDSLTIINSVKVWKAPEEQLQALSEQSYTTVGFDEIKGKNADIEHITDSLTLNNAKMTRNGLEILGWESSSPEILSVDGTVQRPETDTTVILTPIVKFAVPAEVAAEGYITGKGYGMELVIKGTKFSLEDGQQVYMQDAYDTLPTESEASWRSIPTVAAWGNPKAEAELTNEDGALVLRHKSGGVNQYELHMPLTTGTEETARLIPRGGKTNVEFRIMRGEKATGMWAYIRGMDGDHDMLRLKFENSALDIQYGGTDSATSWKDLGSTISLNASAYCDVKAVLDSSTEGETWLEQLYINNTPVLDEKLRIRDMGDGMKMIILASKNGSQGAGDVTLKVDSVKAWTDVKVSQLLGWKDAYLTENGEKVEQLKAGTFTPEFVLQNYTGDLQSVFLAAAVYTDGVMDDVVATTVNGTLPSDGLRKLQAEDTLTITDPAKQTVKYFIWDGAGRMAPLEKVTQ